MNQADAAEIVAMLVMSYPAARISDGSAKVYEKMILDLDAEPTRKAIERLVLTSKFLPSIAEIRAAVVDTQLGPRRSGLEAWGQLGEVIRRVGHYEHPKVQDPVLAECIRLMDWKYLCKSPNEAADRARFVELYEHLSGQQRTAAAIGQLPGSDEQQLPAGVRRIGGTR